MAQHLSVVVVEPGEDPGELAAFRMVQRLEDAPVTARGEPQLVVGQVRRPQAAHHAHGQVLVDDDHGGGGRSAIGWIAKQRVGLRDGVQGGLELVHQVARVEARQDGATFLAQAGVAGTPASAAFLEQLVSERHGTNTARRVDQSVHRASVTGHAGQDVEVERQGGPWGTEAPEGDVEEGPEPVA